MPKPYPRELRGDVIAVVRRREPGVTLTQIATDFGISDGCLSLWLKAATSRTASSLESRGSSARPAVPRLDRTVGDCSPTVQPLTG